MLNDTEKQPQITEVNTKTQPSRANDTGTMSVEAHIRIFDPKTQEVFLEGRA
jgi:hypothetical protein